MAPVFTDDQKRVIETRDANILVAAAAGSGKTAVLTQRILSMIQQNNPIDVDRMLVLTFTKSAAAEMKERIDKTITEALLLNPSDDNLARQQLLLQNAQITTIDSFCLFVVRNNFGEIGVDPSFRTLDEGERSLILKETLDNILERHFQDEQDTSFIRLVERYAGAGSEDNLEKAILSIHRFVLSLPEPEEWFERAKTGFDGSDVETILADKWWQDTKSVRDYVISESIKLSQKGIALCHEEEGPATYEPGFQAFLKLFTELKDNEDYSKVYELLQTSTIPRFSSRAKNLDAREAAKYCKEVIDANYKLLKNTYYAINPEIIAADNAVLKDASDVLIMLAQEVYEEFSQEKRRRNVIDFGDMEHFALKILTTKDCDGTIIPTKTACEFQDYFETVMVDEYQDINSVQERILKSITRDNNYFMVGDVKQSIYKFRQARPDIFNGKYDSFNESGINTKIDLNMNFRSRKQVLSFTNTIFKNILHRPLFEIEYDDNAMLYYGASWFDESNSNLYEPEILLFEKPYEKDASVNEARMVAQKIDELIKSGFEIYDSDKKIMRPVQYRDIVILVFSVSKSGGLFKQEMEKIGIPVAQESGKGYFATLEIKMLLNYLEVINNPVQDIALYGGLTGFFGGFTDEEIAAVKANYSAETHRMSLYESICKYIADNADRELSVRLSDFLKQIEVYRHKVTYMCIRDVLDEVIQTTGYLDYIGALKAGEQRRANVNLLLEKATAFEQTSFHGLFRFVRYIKSLKAGSVDFGEATVLGDNENAVRITTIHKSKGLEYPVCFVSCADVPFQKGESKSYAICSEDYGMAVDYINPENRTKHKAMKKIILNQNSGIDTISEQMRVLYVALTRAREKLYITGTITIDKTAVKNSKTHKDVLLESLPKEGGFSISSLLHVNNYLDMIMPAIASEGMIPKYVSFVSREELQAYEVKTALDDKLTKEYITGDVLDADSEYEQLITERIAREYPYSVNKPFKMKMTVTELKQIAHKDDEYREPVVVTKSESEAYVPRFIQEKEEKVGKNVIGTACHRLMELIDFNQLSTVDRNDDAVLQEFINRCIDINIQNGKMPEEYYGILKSGGKNDPAHRCLNFLKTSLAERMMNASKAGKLYREKPFFMGVKASSIDGDFPEDESVIVQGVIDVFFEEDDGIVIADYKTDGLSSVDADGNFTTDPEKVVKDDKSKADVLINRYKVQLDYYGDAVQRILGKKVKEKYIYSFDIGKEIGL